MCHRPWRLASLQPQQWSLPPHPLWLRRLQLQQLQQPSHELTQLRLLPYPLACPWP